MDFVSENAWVTSHFLSLPFSSLLSPSLFTEYIKKIQERIIGKKKLLPLAFDLTKSNLEIILKYLKTMLKSIINFNIVK